MPRRNKPFDPSAAERAAQERKQREEDKKRMEAQGATVTVDRAGQIISARRSNPFNLLLLRKTITLDHHMAADWFCEHWAAWKGLGGRDEPVREVVNGSGELEDAETAYIAAKQQARAGRMVAGILAAMDPLHRRLLTAFAVATVEEDRPMAWRGVMQRHGVEPGDITVDGARQERQAWTFVQMCEALRAIYQEPREKAA